jgi:hypothetical protein
MMRKKPVLLGALQHLRRRQPYAWNYHRALSHLSITTTVRTRRLVASRGVAQREWIILSRYRSTGIARCIRALRCRVGNGRPAMRRGNIGAALPAIIWSAGIMSSKAGYD